MALLLLILVGTPLPAAEWKLVWSDEFDKPGRPDPARWGYEEGFVRNHERQYYTRDRRENARVENGMLVIEARKERFKLAATPKGAAPIPASTEGDSPIFVPTPTASAKRYPVEARKSGQSPPKRSKGRDFADYTSASLTTLGKASWTYGRIEVRAKLPTGRGTWPAIWTLGTNMRQVGWPACGEMDIMENVGFDPHVIHANVHTKSYNHVLHTNKGAKITLAKPYQDFHVYAVEWRPDRMDFFVDKTKYFTFRNEGKGDATWPYDKPQYLILNIAIGGDWGGQKGIDDGIFPQRMYVDYVRVYQEQGQSSQPGSKARLSIMPARADNTNSTVARVSNVAPRRDTAGHILDAHDGCLHKFGDRYYLYGTAYGRTDGFSKANRYRCYSSPDLMAWQAEGEMLNNPPEGVYYRPYVAYNAKTRKYVLWYNWYPKLWDGQYGVAVGDRPQGPFVIHDANVAVSQPKPGDLGLFVDADGTGYLIYTSIAKGHAISIEKLTEDYLGSTRQSSGVLGTGCEAPVLLKRQGTYYALFDNCCCFCPGGTGVRVYTAAKPLGPYTAKGHDNVNRDKQGLPIVHAQQTHVAQLPTPGGVAYVWMGDRWQSTPDKIKGHDFQYWAPLGFTPDGKIVPFKQMDEWKIELRR